MGQSYETAAWKTGTSGIMPKSSEKVVAYDFPITGNSKILIINNVLYIRDMEHNLLPPIMMRPNGILVDEFLKFLCPNPTIETHSIFFPTENTRLPIAFHGISLYISARSPKVMSEVNEHINIVLTSENPGWGPSSPIYSQQKIEMINWKGEIRTRKKPNL